MTIHIALIGAPGCGLTTLFNQLTGGRSYSPIFSGAASSAKEGPAKLHKSINIIQLPAIRTLSPSSADDHSVRQLLLEQKPDVLVNVVDASDFRHGLYLTTQLTELDLPIVLALNMMDEIKRNHIIIDIPELSRRLDMPVIPISSARGRGIATLLQESLKAASGSNTSKPIRCFTGQLYTALHSIQQLAGDEIRKSEMPLPFCCTRLLEEDTFVLSSISLSEEKLEVLNSVILQLQQRLDTDCASALASMRYNYIDTLWAQTFHPALTSTKEKKRALKADQLLTHPLFSLPLFIGIMLFIFYLTFDLAGAFLSSYLSFGVEKSICLLSHALHSAKVSPAFHSLVIDGICAGVGSVISFLPYIAVLFFCLSILEDSGYTCRTSFILDKLLGKLGLSGRCIVPMIIGFGCTVPAAMAVRSLPGKRDRFLTILMLPFMSCSAKLPVYAMFTAAFFPRHKALVMACLYLCGILTAVASALLFKNTIFKSRPEPLVLPLMPYRMPSMKNVFLRVLKTVCGFIQKAFTVILAASVMVWLLQNFDTSFHMTSDSSSSLLAFIGKALAPCFSPLGFGNWQSAATLITGISAKETIVSTLAVLMQSNESLPLSAMLSPLFTPASAASFLTFCLLYTPCISALAAIRKETESWLFAVGIAIFQCFTAWILSFLVFSAGSLCL